LHPFGAWRRPLVTYALILANLAVFALEVRAADPERFVAAFATIPYDVAHRLTLPPPSPPHAYLTLLSAQFIHAGAFHLISNLLVLYAFGPLVEAATGHLRYLFLYVLCGVAGNVAEVLVMPGSHVPSIGASGAIAGVLGAYLTLFPTRPLFWRIPAVLVIGAWAATQFFSGFGAVSEQALPAQAGGIAYFTHIGGFLCGIIAIGPLRRREVAAGAARY
jgi:membrane associated rhomboid family serine protease